MTFEWRDATLEGQALEERVRQNLEARSFRPTATEQRWLDDRWGGSGTTLELALHFMERFAPVTGRLARGLAYTAVTTLRLEKPLGQQEEFNRATLLFCNELLSEIAALRRRIVELEAKSDA